MTERSVSREGNKIVYPKEGIKAIHSKKGDKKSPIKYTLKRVRVQEGRFSKKIKTCIYPINILWRGGKKRDNGE